MLLRAASTWWVTEVLCNLARYRAYTVKLLKGVEVGSNSAPALPSAM